MNHSVRGIASGSDIRSSNGWYHSVQPTTVGLDWVWQQTQSRLLFLEAEGDLSRSRWMLMAAPQIFRLPIAVVGRFVSVYA